MISEYKLELLERAILRLMTIKISDKYGNI